jgi:hypothetical protein
MMPGHPGGWHIAKPKFSGVKTKARPVSNAQSAKSAGLIYVTDGAPGIHRRRRGRGFTYIDRRGRVIRNRAELDRLARLAIPPAWIDVWICESAKGHLQACGRDARGRKQYRYHQEWRQFRDEVKYDQMLAFAMALPALRRRIARDLSAHGLPRRKVIAAVVQLLEKTLIRVGNDEYARDNNSFGLTTMRNKHVRVSKSTLRFRFKGKGGKSHDIAFNDSRLARIVRRCQDLPGHELFGYIDMTVRCRISGPPTSTNTSAKPRGRISPRRAFARGQRPCSRRAPFRNCQKVDHTLIPNATSTGPSKPSPAYLETRRPSAGRVISTRRCWRHIRRAPRRGLDAPVQSSGRWPHPLSISSAWNLPSWHGCNACSAQRKSDQPDRLLHAYRSPWRSSCVTPLN